MADYRIDFRTVNNPDSPDLDETVSSFDPSSLEDIRSQLAQSMS
jgi:hypothetical protein